MGNAKAKISEGSLVGLNLVSLDGTASPARNTGRVVRAVVSPEGEVCAYVVAISGWPKGGYIVGDQFSVGPEQVVAQ